MTIKIFLAATALSMATVLAAPVQAKIIDQSDIGFSVAHMAQLSASPDEVWDMLRMPQKWWSKDHSWSGNAENFWLDSQAGGCFCEKIPQAGGSFGSVQHARIIFANPGQMLRLSGALGPLQGEAVTGTLTILIKKSPTGSVVRFDYVVGGYMRLKLDEIAPDVDRVIGAQLLGLANALGGALPPSRDEKASAAAATGVAKDKDDVTPPKDAAAAEATNDLGNVISDLVGSTSKEEGSESPDTVKPD